MRKILLAIFLVLIPFFLSYQKAFATDATVTLGQGGFVHIKSDYWQDFGDGTFGWTNNFNEAFDLDYNPVGFYASQELNLPVSAIHALYLNWQTQYSWFGLRVCPVYTDQTETCADFWAYTKPTDSNIVSILDPSKTVHYIKFTNAYHGDLSRNGLYGPITLTYDSSYSLPGTYPTINLPPPGPQPYTMKLGVGGFNNVNASFWADNNDGTFYFTNIDNVFDSNFNPQGYYSTGPLNIPVSDLSTFGGIIHTQYAWFGYQACVVYTDTTEHCGSYWESQRPIIQNLTPLLDSGKTVYEIKILPAYYFYWSSYGVFGPFTLTFVYGYTPNLPPVANAGDDQIVLVNELVSLDGSGSSDPDSDPLTYTWSEDASNPQTGILQNSNIINPSFTPIIAGTYTFSLIVNDGKVDSTPDSIIITVQSQSEAIEDLIDLVESFNILQRIENSLDVKLDAALNALDDANQNNDQAAINSLQAFINATEAQREKMLTDEQADRLIAAAQAIINSFIN